MGPPPTSCDVTVALAQVNLNTRPALKPPSDRLRPKTVQQRLTNQDRDRIAQAYAEGLSFAEVADRERVARSTVMRIVRSRGVMVRPWGVKYR